MSFTFVSQFVNSVNAGSSCRLTRNAGLHPSRRKDRIGVLDSGGAARHGGVDVRRDTGELSRCAGAGIGQIDVFRFGERIRELVDHDLIGLNLGAKIRKPCF